MRHEGRWRDSGAIQRRDICRNYLHRFVERVRCAQALRGGRGWGGFEGRWHGVAGLLGTDVSRVCLPYEKTSTVSSAVLLVAASGAISLVAYPSVVRFVGHLQLKGLAPRTVEAYVCMIRLLAQWASCDPVRSG